jgi:hypothetical protein
MEPRYIVVAVILFIVLVRGPVLVRRYFAKRKGLPTESIGVE